jgi:hypothetical protein
MSTTALTAAAFRAAQGGDEDDQRGYTGRETPPAEGGIGRGERRDGQPRQRQRRQDQRTVEA